MKARSENSFFLSLKKNTNLQIITKKISYAFKIKGLKLHAYLEAHYLEGRFETLKKIQEEAAHYQGKSMQYKVDTHEHGLYLRHHIDSLKKYTGLSYEKTRQLLEIYFFKRCRRGKIQTTQSSSKKFLCFYY